MKLKYDLNTNEIICMGEMPELSGDGVVDVSFSIPSEPLSHFTFNGELVRKSEQEIAKIDAEAKFNFKTFEGRLNQIMDVGSIIKLSQFLRTLEGMCNWPNFSGVKQLLQALVANGIMTTVESGQITSCLAEQGIDLGQY